MEIVCNVKRLLSVKDKDLQKALKIYHEAVPANIRTNENEICDYIENKYQSQGRDMLFYALCCNKEVIGYAEIGALWQSRAFFIAYFILLEQYSNHAYFYMCYNLMVKDLKNLYPHYNYIIAEYYIEDSKKADYSFGKRCLSLEGYKIIDQKYLQPGLNWHESDSVVECQLLINETSSVNILDKLSADKYIALLEDIYFNHYIEWFSHFYTASELQTYRSKACDIIASAKKHCEKEVRLNNFTYINCRYYNPTRCGMTIHRPFSVPRKITRKKYFLILVIAVIVTNLITYGCYLVFSNFFSLDNEIIAILFSVGTEVVVFIISNVLWDR